jgi:hypothetical protein
MAFLAIAIVGLMVGAAILWLVPANVCDKCDHCRAERLEYERRRQDQRHRSLHAWYGGELCPVCRPNG